MAGVEPGAVFDPSSRVAAEEEEVEELPCPTTSDLKALGNAAHKRGDLRDAVDFWQRALQSFAENLAEVGSAQEAAGIERSLYLNLAQGYLQLGEPDRTARACFLVLQDNPKEEKALYRLAEASLAKGDSKVALEWLGKLLEAVPGHAAATKLQRRIREERRFEKRRSKELAARMYAGTTNFSEGHETTHNPERQALVDRLGADGVAATLGIADEVAAAAQRRARREPPQPAAPVSDDLDAFRAKVMAKTGKMSNYMQKSRRGKESAQTSLKLSWLRGGGEREALNAFETRELEELRQLEARDLAARAAADSEDSDGDAEPPLQADAAASNAGLPDCRMDEMD